MRAMSASAPLLILLPGLDGSARLFEPLVAAIAALDPGIETRAIAYPSDRALGYAELAASIAPQLPTDRPFVLLGESFAGPLAIMLAAARPPGLVGLVLCCTFARNPRPWTGALARPLLGALPLRRLPVAPLCLALAGRAANAHWRAELRAALAPLNDEVLRARARAVLDVDARPALAAVRVPLLELRARHDRVVPAAAGRDIAAAGPPRRLVVLDGPHFLLQVAPQPAAAELSRFTAELTRAGSLGPEMAQT